jgi:hypothetical protein
MINSYLKLGERIALEYYCVGIIECFWTELLRCHTFADTQRLLAKPEKHGFHSMLGSIDCMYCQCHNCSVSWQAQFTWEDIKYPTIIFEVVTLDMTCFFGVAESNNDINVLNQWSWFVDVTRGHTSEVSCTVNGCEHHIRYYFTDDIYPSWPMFMKGVYIPQQEKHQFFSAKQSTLRKDVEYAFDLLKKMFNILVIPDRSYSQCTLRLIMRVSIILHNMIINDEWYNNYDENYHTVTSIIVSPINYETTASLTSIL